MGSFVPGVCSLNQLRIDNSLDTWTRFDAINVSQIKKQQVASFISKNLDDIQRREKTLFEDPDPEIIGVLLAVINFLKEELNQMRQDLLYLNDLL